MLLKREKTQDSHSKSHVVPGHQEQATGFPFASDNKTPGRERESRQMLKGSMVIMRENYNKEQCKNVCQELGGNTETSTDANVVGTRDMLVHGNRCQSRTKEA